MGYCGLKWEISPVFRGINAVNIDAKGRIAIPARCRSKLEQEAHGQLVVTVDTEERCLLLYPLPEWEIIERKLQGLPSFHRQSRRIQRLLIGHATDVEIDSHGRILLPALLREYAELDKPAVFIGQGNKFEIWSEAHWTAGRDQWLAEEMGDESELPEELQALAL